ncbi:MAG: glucans biosynthesis glucosyltransferase MdoH [Pseudomonadota bacterium]
MAHRVDTLEPPPPSSSRQPASETTLRASRRVANYLRTLGLSDPARVRALSRELADGIPAASPEQHAALAVARAQARFEAWREALYQALPVGVDPLWLRAFIAARPELFLGDPERSRRAAARFGDARAGKGPQRAYFRPQAFEPARLPRWLRGLLPPIGLTLAASYLLWRVLCSDGGDALELAWVLLFAFLFGQAATGLSTAALGFALRRHERATPELPALTGPLGRTALLMPIYHESPEDVFAALAGMREALSALPEASAFEMFVLSDSRDPQVCADEERAFRRVAAEAGSVPIYYHRRVHNERQKAGNLAEFFERWAPRYEFAVTLDADSVMTAELLVELVRRMQADPQLGLLQAPLALHRTQTLFARAQAFAASVCGPNFNRGLAAWSGTCGNFYGHNAVLRVRAFLDCCQLPKLNGEPPFGGHVLSHDFVEAALLCRAGWHVRIAHDLDTGSYEELPPTLSEYVVRDRRWCQGNLQHLAIVRMRGLEAMSRIHLLLGACAYLAGPGWFLFVGLGLLTWQSGGPHFALVARLVGLVTLAALLGPWLLGVCDTLQIRQRRAAHGGTVRVLLGGLLGVLIGAALAPLLMLHHTRIVLGIVAGRAVGWSSQQRRAQSQLSRVLRDELPATLLGAGAAALAVFQGGEAWIWLAPVWLPWLLAMPLHALVSSEWLGSLVRRAGLLVTPHELQPDPLLSRIEQLRGLTRGDVAGRFRDVVLDPVLLAAHLDSLDGQRPSISDRRLDRLRERALAEGPFSLSPAEWRFLAANPERMQQLHREAWQRWPVESWDLGSDEPQLPPDTVGSRP